VESRKAQDKNLRAMPPGPVDLISWPRLARDAVSNRACPNRKWDPEMSTRGAVELRLAVKSDCVGSDREVGSCGVYARRSVSHEHADHDTNHGRGHSSILRTLPSDNHFAMRDGYHHPRSRSAYATVQF
jgi:hypothetical protein